jgi:hypothetical protein
MTSEEENKIIAVWLGWKNVGHRWHPPACQRDEAHCTGKNCRILTMIWLLLNWRSINLFVMRRCYTLKICCFPILLKIVRRAALDDWPSKKLCLNI